MVCESGILVCECGIGIGIGIGIGSGIGVLVRTSLILLGGQRTAGSAPQKGSTIGSLFTDGAQIGAQIYSSS